MTANAPIDNIDLNTKDGILAYIALEAPKQGVEASIVADVIRCESEFRGGVYGDSGMAYGLAQFWPETFERLSKKAGIPEMYERGDYRSQIKTLIWSIKNGSGGEWTCFTKITHRL